MNPFISCAADFVRFQPAVLRPGGLTASAGVLLSQRPSTPGYKPMHQAASSTQEYTPPWAAKWSQVICNTDVVGWIDWLVAKQPKSSHTLSQDDLKRNQNTCKPLLAGSGWNAYQVTRPTIKYKVLESVYFNQYWSNLFSVCSYLKQHSFCLILDLNGKINRQKYDFQ